MAIGTVLAAVLLLLSSCQLIGGAGNTFGNDPTRAGTQPGLWASINGPYTSHADGDPFATHCAGGAATATSCDSGGANPLYSGDGYVWVVKVLPSQVGLPISVQIYDPELGTTTNATDNVSANGAFATSYQLFDTTGSDTSLDLTPANSMAALGRCSASPGSKVFAAGSSESMNAWYSLCTFTPTRAGLYPLQVKTSAIPGVVDAGGGFNNFSIRATSTAPTKPIVAAYDKSSVFVSTVGSASRSYLTDIDETHAGQKLVLQLFDPGDAPAGDAQIHVLAPPSGSPAEVPTGGASVACTYSGPSTLPATTTSNYSSTCAIATRIASAAPPNFYNGKWLRIEVPIPLNYTCSTDCWWTLEYTFSDASTDRVVYMAAVVPSS